MTWGKVDDKLHSHPKPERAGVHAMGLWVLALSYCCDYLTDGYVTPERVARLAGKAGARLAETLCDAGMWHAADADCDDEECRSKRLPSGTTGWRFHEWGTYQPTRASVETEQKRKAEAGRRGGISKARRVAEALAPASPVPAEDPRKSSASALPPIPIPIPIHSEDPPVVPHGGTAPAQSDAPPVEPVAARPAKATKASDPRRSRCPASTDPDAPAWLERWQLPPLDARVAKFLDHHRGKGNRMVDWLAAWRTWLGNEPLFGRASPRFDPRQQPAPPGESFWTPATETDL